MPYLRSILFFVFLMLPLLLMAQEQDELLLTGVYNGKNLYVQNPLSNNMKDYCTQEVWVNDRQVFSNPRSSAFTVNLSHLPELSPVNIRIVYKNGCAPKVINPQVIYSRNDFRFLTIHVDSNRIEWVSGGEQGKGKYFIEKWENDRWKPLKSQDAAGEENSRYQADLVHSSGLNKYRIKFLQGDGQVFYSSVQNFESAIEAVTFAPTRVSDKIFLSRETDYIVSDAKGNQLLKGSGKEISLGHLSSGLYYLSIDNRTEKFYKK